MDVEGHMNKFFSIGRGNSPTVNNTPSLFSLCIITQMSEKHAFHSNYMFPAGCTSFGAVLLFPLLNTFLVLLRRFW